MINKILGYQEIIIEALEDYKRWFKDLEMTEEDKEKVKLIDEAIKFIGSQS